jgi:hypothetical protein
MDPRTIATLGELDKAHWFSRVGVRDAATATVLASWQGAIAHCSSIEWENLCLEMANQYRERLFERSKERFEMWNGIVNELKKTTRLFVRRKIEPVIREHKPPKVFEDTVQWDILHVCMEAEYADVYPPGFYASLASWYIKGHFPCGWQGVFPRGMQVIY